MNCPRQGELTSNPLFLLFISLCDGKQENEITLPTLKQSTFRIRKTMISLLYRKFTFKMAHALLKTAKREKKREGIRVIIQMLVSFNQTQVTRGD